MFLLIELAYAAKYRQILLLFVHGQSYNLQSFSASSVLKRIIFITSRIKESKLDAWWMGVHNTRFHYNKYFRVKTFIENDSGSYIKHIR